MAATLTFFSRRRLINTALLAGAAAAIWEAHDTRVESLRAAALFTGAVLFFTCVGLAFFNARKKLPFIPLLKASTWTQFHIYAGWFSVAVFLVHTGFRIPNGRFETALYIVFSAVALSGVFGLIISRVYPQKLRMHGENVMYERIPALRHQLQKDTEQVIWKSIQETKSFTLAKFYESRLKKFFAQQQNTFGHLIGSEAAFNRLNEELQQLQRYMVPAERTFLAEIIECVAAKDNLDQQRACQGMLKYWLFVHIPLTFSLLLLGGLHGLLALSFS
jgi:hypothetical protein